MKFLLLLIPLLLFAAPASAEIYKWTDEQGQVHYSDQKPQDQDFNEVEIEGGTYKNVSYGTTHVDIGKQVIMLSAVWCGVCKKAKSYFRRNGIQFTELDVEKNSRGKRLYERLGAKAVPVILVGRKRMNGFTEAGFKRIYE